MVIDLKCAVWIMHLSNLYAISCKTWQHIEIFSVHELNIMEIVLWVLN